MVGALFETSIKYELLDDMIGKYIQDIRYSNNVNVIIDLKSVYKKCYRTDLNNIIKDQKIVIEDITSHIVNMIGFYRNYLYKAGKYSTFYLVYSSKECDALKNIYPDYKKYYYEKYLNNKDEYLNMNNIIKSVTKQLKILCRYIPHTLFIESYKYDELIYINYLIREHVNKTDINLLFTQDPILLQTLNKNTYAIDMKGINSKVISENESVNYLCEKQTTTDGNLLNLVLCAAGDKEYSINKLNNFGYKKAEKFISGFKLPTKFNMFFPEKITTCVDDDTAKLLKENFNIIFPLRLQMENVLTIQEEFNKQTIKVDYAQFKELNEKNFVLYPLNLSCLLKGELL